MPNMPPPYEICAAHAERLAGLENKSNRRSYEALSGPAGGLVQVQTEGAMPAAGESPARRTQSSKPVNNVFHGRKPDLHRMAAAVEEAREATSVLCDLVETMMDDLMAMHGDTRTHRQRIADLWSRMDALHEYADGLALELADTKRTMEELQKRLREMDEDSHGERG